MNIFCFPWVPPGQLGRQDFSALWVRLVPPVLMLEIRALRGPLGLLGRLGRLRIRGLAAESDRMATPDR